MAKLELLLDGPTGSPRLLLACLSHEIQNMGSENLLAGVPTLVGGGFIVSML